MVCRIKQRFQKADMTLWSKVKVTNTQNLSIASNVNTSFIFDLVWTYSQKWLPIMFRLQQKSQNMDLTLKSRVKVKYS